MSVDPLQHGAFLEEDKPTRVGQKERVAKTVVKINGYIVERQYLFAASALTDLLQIDIFSGTGFMMQTPMVIRELFVLQGNQNGIFGRTVLMAIRKLQISRQRETYSFGLLKRERRRLDSLEFINTHCRYREIAEHVVLLLASRKLVTAGHLGKQLEIDLASVDPKAVLPHDMLLWLRGFYQHNVEPDINTMTIIINAYLQHEDSGFAIWIYEQMQRGVISVTRQDYSVENIAVPAPNAVTEALLAEVWIKRGDLDPVLRLLSRLEQQKEQSILQRLVTRAVSGLVEQGRTDEAELVLKRFSIQDDGQHKGVNVRALIKLSLGHIRSSNLDRAFLLFETACKSISSDDVSSGLVSILYLSSLLNSLLHAFLRRPAYHCKHIHACLLVARTHNIPFNTTTFNILLARLSRIAARAACVSKTSLELDKVASAMQRLYVNMVHHDVDIDDMTLCHLAPLWIHLGLEELVKINWEWITRGRSRGKIDQLRRHLLHHIKHWDLGEQATKLVIGL
ncbi:hypothetical protein LPJ64_000278 [Coemansia asiatica]|uniref:Uncharacterized protein n=1 Tax=Coemansia asiatica TaxID=1052880 RepID=A0A9W7XS94_9FUNG|nr:hypothetical protein LPJ64_000278 [Coemansia asiatica]